MSVTIRQLQRLTDTVTIDGGVVVHLGSLTFPVERAGLIQGVIHLHVDPDLLFNAIAPLLERQTTGKE